MKNAKRGRPAPKKEPVVSLVERGGEVRSFHVPDVTAKSLRRVLVTQIERKSYLMTDESGSYVAVGREFGGHGAVHHSIEEYVRGGLWHTNTQRAISRSSSAGSMASITMSAKHT